MDERKGVRGAREGLRDIQVRDSDRERGEKEGERKKEGIRREKTGEKKIQINTWR